jgi:hypothetical protein
MPETFTADDFAKTFTAADFAQGGDESAAVAEPLLKQAERTSDVAAAGKASLGHLRNQEAFASGLGAAEDIASRTLSPNMPSEVLHEAVELPQRLVHAGVNLLPGVKQTDFVPAPPLLTPEQVQAGRDLISNPLGGSPADEPRFGTIPSPNSLASQLGEGASQGINELVSGATSPETIVGIAAGTQYPQTVLSLFKADILSKLPEGLANIWRSKSPQELAKNLVVTGGQIGTYKLMDMHAPTGPETPPFRGSSLPMPEGSRFGVSEPPETALEYAGGEMPKTPATSFEAPAPKAKPANPAKVAEEIGFNFNPVRQAGAIKLEGLPPEMQTKLLAAQPAQWEFTEKGTDPDKPRLTFYVPEGSTREQILARLRAKRQADIDAVPPEPSETELDYGQGGEMPKGPATSFEPPRERTPNAIDQEQIPSGVQTQRPPTDTGRLSETPSSRSGLRSETGGTAEEAVAPQVAERDQVSPNAGTDRATVDEFNKQATLREELDKTPKGFYQLSPLTPETAGKLSDASLLDQLNESIRTLSEVHGKSSGDAMVDKAKDATYRLNVSVLHDEAVARGLAQPQDAIVRYYTPKLEPPPPVTEEARKGGKEPIKLTDSLGNKHFWAKTRADIEREGKEKVKYLRGQRAEVNKLKGSEAYATWRLRSSSRQLKADIENAQQYTKGLLDVHKERIQEALAEGKPVPPEVLADYPDLGPPSPTPIPKAQEKMTKVAKTEGARAAKDIKDELIDELQLKLQKAPAEADWKPEDGAKVTVQIPDDGTFTVKNTVEAISETIDRAKKLKVDAGKPPGVPKASIKSSAGAIKATAGMNAEIAKQKALEAEAEKSKPKGMGGAVPSEFEEPNTVVSNMFAAIDRDNLEMGKPPMERGDPRTWDEDNRTALARMNRDPLWIPNLIREVLKSPRPLLSWENAGLVWHRAKLKAEWNNALQRIARSAEDNNPESLAQAQTDAAVFEDQIDELNKAVGRGGTGSEAGRSLQAQKMGAGEDFTLVEMTLQKRASLGGRKLTADEQFDVQRKFEEQKKANDELTKHLADRDNKIAQLEVDKALAEAKAQAPRFDKRILDAAESIVKKLETAGDAAERRLVARLGRTSALVDPLIVPDAAIYLSAKIARLGLDAAKATDHMIEKFGEGLRDLMPQIWAKANELIDNSTKGDLAVRKAVKSKSEGPADAKQVAAESIKEKLQAGETSKVSWVVQRLARELVASGITDREQLINAVHEVLKESDPNITRREAMDAISGYGRFKQLNKDQISVALRGMKGEMQQLAKLEDMAMGKPPSKTGVERRTPTDAERRLIKAVNDAKHKFQIPVENPATQLKSALDTVKTTLENRIKDYTDRLARKDYSVTPRKAVELDSKAMQLKAKAEALKQKWKKGLEAERLKNRPNWEKALDWITKFRRFEVLSSIKVVPKLFSAGLNRLVSMIGEEGIAKGYRQVPGYRSLFELAPLEGSNTSLRQEMKGYGASFVKGLSDAASILRSGRSELDVLFGKQYENYTGEHEMASNILDFPGRVHGMIKAPVKRIAFEAAVQRLGEYYAKQGVDVTTDLAKTRIAVEAYKYANRQIFLQDNRVSKAFNAALNTLTAKSGPGGKVGAAAARFVFPIVKVPINIVAETMQYAGGLVSGNVRLGLAFKRGIETLKPEEADLIARHLKKGSIGAAVIALGYFSADKFGGYYQPNQKKKPGQPGWGEVRVLGVNVPSWLLHNPMMELLQFGATIRHVADSKLRKKDTQLQGLSSGAMAATLGLVDEVPFVREMAEFEKLHNPYSRDSFLQAQAKSAVVPAFVQNAAEWTDPAFYKDQKRAPQSVGQAIESGIPGLRERVPIKGQAKGATPAPKASTPPYFNKLSPSEQQKWREANQ